jgi:pyruvate formate lyase activating enzyme
MAPDEVVKQAKATGCRSISYTYTEPTMFYEYAFDIAKLAKEEGISNNFVTNGYIEEKPLETIRPYLDAANIDLKSISGEFYKKVCGARVEGVLASVKKYKQLGIWVELTTLVIRDTTTATRNSDPSPPSSAMRLGLRPRGTSAPSTPPIN